MARKKTKENEKMRESEIAAAFNDDPPSLRLRHVIRPARRRVRVQRGRESRRKRKKKKIIKLAKWVGEVANMGGREREGGERMRRE